MSILLTKYKEPVKVIMQQLGYYLMAFTLSVTFTGIVIYIAYSIVIINSGD